MPEIDVTKLDAEEKNKINHKREYMITQPVEKLVCKMAVPTVISMLVTALYNFADTFFVGQIGSNTATGAVGLAFSYMAIIQAVGCFYRNYNWGHRSVIPTSICTFAWFNTDNAGRHGLLYYVYIDCNTVYDEFLHVE